MEAKIFCFQIVVIHLLTMLVLDVKNAKTKLVFNAVFFQNKKESEHLWNEKNDVRIIRQNILKTIRDEIAKLSKTDKNCIHIDSCYTIFQKTIEIEKRDKND